MSANQSHFGEELSQKMTYIFTTFKKRREEKNEFTNFCKKCIIKRLTRNDNNIELKPAVAMGKEGGWAGTPLCAREQLTLVRARPCRRRREAGES